jgi:hypothetical protein
VTNSAKLLRSRQSCWSRTYNGHFFPAAMPRQLRLNPAFGEPALNDTLFDLLDRHRRLIDAQHASRFAWRGTNPPGEFRKIIGGVQLPNGIFPAAAINQIVPVGDDVIDRTSCVTERDAAIHTARALVAQLRLRKILIDFEPIVHAFCDWPARGEFTAVFHEAGGLTHAAPVQVPHLRAGSGREGTVVTCGSRPTHV